MKNIEEFATEYAQGKYLPVQTSQAVKAGANYVLDEIEEFMANINLGNSAAEKFYKLDLMADIHEFIEQLKK